MKATLAVPAEWCQDNRYAALQAPEFCAALGHSISQSLQTSALLYRDLPAQFPVEIEWVPNNTNPTNATPCLYVATDGTRQNPIAVDLNMAIRRFMYGMKRSELYRLIPECEILLALRLERSITFDQSEY